MTRWGAWRSWRQDPSERLIQDAFLSDIEAHWRPGSARERRLALVSAVVHQASRLFDGPPTMAPAFAAGAMAAVGTAMLPAAAVPSNPDYALGPPTWAYLLITVGLIGMAYETARSPHSIRPLTYALLVALPIGVGTAVVGVLLHVATPADRVLQFGVPAFGLGVILLAVFQATRRFTLQRVTLRVTAVAFALTAVGQFDWAWMYGDSGYVLLAVASACTAAGALFNAVGFARFPVAGSTRA